MEFKILREPLVRLVPYGYELIEDGALQVGMDVYLIPKGFQTDFASVPAMLRGLIDNDAAGIRIPAILHDAMYGGVVPVSNKEKADFIFREFCIAQGLPTWKAWAAWLAVKMCGAESWDKGDH